MQRAANLAGRWGSVCIDDMLHFQIVNGRLYVRFLTGNAKGAGIHNADSDGWFPGDHEAGAKQLQPVLQPESPFSGFRGRCAETLLWQISDLDPLLQQSRFYYFVSRGLVMAHCGSR